MGLENKEATIIERSNGSGINDGSEKALNAYFDEVYTSGSPAEKKEKTGNIIWPSKTRSRSFWGTNGNWWTGTT